jgi:hypothetical protein
VQAPDADADLRFLRVFGVERPPATWVASNRGLHRLIRRHHRQLGEAAAVAAAIRRALTAIFPLLDSVSRVTCPECPDPCCVVTTVWFDFIDLLFLHLIAVPLPPAPLANRLSDPCRYLSPHGCRLTRLVRPWGCLQYTCPTQRSHLRRQSPPAEAPFDEAIAKIKKLRYQLESEFERIVVSRPLGPLATAVGQTAR